MTFLGILVPARTSKACARRLLWRSEDSRSRAREMPSTRLGGDILTCWISVRYFAVFSVILNDDFSCLSDKLIREVAVIHETWPSSQIRRRSGFGLNASGSQPLPTASLSCLNNKEISLGWMGLHVDITRPSLPFCPLVHLRAVQVVDRGIRALYYRTPGYLYHTEIPTKKAGS